MVLLGLALIQQSEANRVKAKSRKASLNEDTEGKESEESEATIENRVAEFTQAVAPVLLPIIESLGELDDDPAAITAGYGEAT